MKFHFFHVTNPKEVKAGTERPRIVEKGPYSYRQYRTKVNISGKWEGEDRIREVYKRSILSPQDPTFPEFSMIGTQSWYLVRSLVK